MKIISLRQGFTADHSSTSYEFLAVDRPLNKEAKKKVAALSSRANPTARRVNFVYNVDGYDLPGGWERLMQEYYDVMYSESYDWWLLAMAFNPSQAQREELLRYQFNGTDDMGVDISGDGERVVVAINCRLERSYIDPPDEWEEDDESEEETVDEAYIGDGLLDLLAKIRQQLQNGDYRCLYAVWEVYGAAEDNEDDMEEKPTPPPDKAEGQTLVDTFRNMLINDL
jgi:hypothetical protein